MAIKRKKLRRPQEPDLKEAVRKVGEIAKNGANALKKIIDDAYKTPMRKEVSVATTLPEIEWDGHLSNSARTTYLNCRKQFEWQYLRRLSPRAVSVPFLVGGLVHNGLEHMYKLGRFDEDAERAAVKKACAVAARTAGMTQTQSDRVYQQSAMIMGILKGYAKYYLERDLARWEVLEAEAAFEYKLRNGWSAVGKRDMVVRERKSKKIILVEHKTAATIDADYVAKLPLDAQIIGYVRSLQKSLGKLPDGVCYNVIKKVAIRQKQTESFNGYLKRVEDVYFKEPANYFYRETLSFTAKNVEDFAQELDKFSEEMDRSIKENFFYKNTSHCTRYGVCPYMRMCIDGPNKDTLSHFRIRGATHEELVDQKDEGGLR